ncbi:MAG: dephospho-CoA kinase [Lachnospiraceae bacterium]|nr:dephospho-CoA kinase [Lachnospiraceae bacterium]
MKFIGITGGVGAGKSELIKYIGKHYKCRIYLADEVAHEVRKPGTDCYKELCGLLGEDVVADKKRMAAKVFADEKLLEKVNAIVHPAVEKYLLKAYREAAEDGETELFFVEAALLIEAGYKKIADELWYVYANNEVRIKRLMDSRGYSREKAVSIMDSQLSDKEFRENCDFVIDNSGSLENATESIRRRLEGYTWLM